MRWIFLLLLFIVGCTVQEEVYLDQGSSEFVGEWEGDDVLVLSSGGFGLVGDCIESGSIRVREGVMVFNVLESDCGNVGKVESYFYSVEDGELVLVDENDIMKRYKKVE